GLLALPEINFMSPAPSDPWNVTALYQTIRASQPPTSPRWTEKLFCTFTLRRRREVEGQNDVPGFGRRVVHARHSRLRGVAGARADLWLVPMVAAVAGG